MIVSTIKCDICKKEKGERNKWLSAVQVDSLTLTFFPGRTTKSDKILDICSKHCLNELISRTLDAIQIEQSKDENGNQ